MNYVIKAFVYCITWVLLSFSPNAKKKIIAITLELLQLLMQVIAIKSKVIGFCSRKLCCNKLQIF